MYTETLHRITKYTLHNFKSAIDAGMIVHDLKHLTGGCGVLKELTE